jgi:hypothetical protein
MTRTPFDQFCNRLLEEFLSSLGDVQLNLEVPGESRFVDVWFMPNAGSGFDGSSLGLLGQLVITPCLIEPFRNPPTSAQIRNCPLKLLLKDDPKRAIADNRFASIEKALPLDEKQWTR